MDPAAPASSPGEPPAQAAAPRRRPGCRNALLLGCGGLLTLLLGGTIFLYLNIGSALWWLEARFIRRSLEISGADAGTREKVEAVLQEHEEARKKERFGPSRWWATAEAFERSPAVIVLTLLVSDASLAASESIEPAEKERLRKAIRGLLRAVAEGAVRPEEFLLLVRRAREGRLGEDPEGPATHIDLEDLRRFSSEAEKLLSERGAPEGLFEIDIAGLVRRDLSRSLEAARAAPN